MYSKLLAVVVFWLIAINLFALIALNRFNLSPDTAYTWLSPTEFFQTQSFNLIDLHCRWDCKWYTDIVQNGYQYQKGQLSNVVFFPLYPLLVKIGSFFTLSNITLAGWLVSGLALYGAAIYLYKLVRQFHPSIDPWQPVLFLLIFPTAFFLNAVYTESLFLFLTVACFYYTLRKNYLLAALFGAMATLTRLTGFILFFPLVYEYLQSQNFKFKITKEILPVVMIPFAALIFPLYHWYQFGDFLLFLKVQDGWGRSFAFNTDHFQLTTPAAITNFVLDLSFIILILIAIGLVFKKLRVSYGLFMIAAIAIPLSTGTLMSINRYILPLFPLFILFSSFKNTYVKLGLAFVQILLLALTTILYVNNYWAG